LNGITFCFPSRDRGRLLHVFGSGHSHVLGLELFYRAGGFACVNPILLEHLMLHRSASASTTHERTSGQAEAIAQQHALAAGDVLLCISNSGANVVAIELARIARQRGLAVIALVSAKHATSAQCRANPDSAASGSIQNVADTAPDNLMDCADVVLDNHGEPGDAATSIGGEGGSQARADLAALPLMGATSTVVGAALVNAVAVRTAELMVGAGHADAIDVFISANVKGGDAHNERLIAKYIDRVEAL
jgi:uncharacterized phosphosugar-binding protein